jgi:hypothetical protein
MGDMADYYGADGSGLDPDDDPLDIDKKLVKDIGDRVLQYREQQVYAMITGDTRLMPTPLPDTLVDVISEMHRAERLHPTHPDDPLRATCIMCEEAGEALKAAMDLTRCHTQLLTPAEIARGVVPQQLPKTARDELDGMLELYKETCETAAAAIRNLVKMREMIEEIKRHVG